jgi:hypothetical protein
MGLAGVGLGGGIVAAVAIAGAFTVPFATQPSVALRLHAAPDEVRATTMAIGRAGVLFAAFTGGVLWSLVAGVIGVGPALLLSGSLTVGLYLADRLFFRPRLMELELTA